MKRLIVLLALLALIIPASAGARHDSPAKVAANPIFYGYVYWQNGITPAPGATVIFRTNCGVNVNTYAANPSGYWPGGGGGIVTPQLCHYDIYASTGGCTQWYSDTRSGTAVQVNNDIRLILNHSVRVCSRVTAGPQ